MSSWIHDRKINIIFIYVFTQSNYILVSNIINIFHFPRITCLYIYLYTCLARVLASPNSTNNNPGTWISLNALPVMTVLYPETLRENDFSSSIKKKFKKIIR